MSIRNLSRAAVAVTSIGVLGILQIGSASASGKTSAYSMGREAARVTYWSSTDDFRVSDTLCDGHSVYAQYQRAGARMQKLSNSQGCHHYSDFNRSFTGGQTIKYRVCVSLPFGDNCSSWRRDSTS
ncbi:hypothetical protein ACGFYV_20675 [Streptomyces sp. NPDC048297]|uniref:hypothetical protein n=1 Tax=Streptomyces sp. NPDC048297 TaxID=3365531 RepID=UPI0037209050